jgi:hypothetical protein
MSYNLRATGKACISNLELGNHLSICLKTEKILKLTQRFLVFMSRTPLMYCNSYSVIEFTCNLIIS